MPASSFFIGILFVGVDVAVVPDLRDLMTQKTSAARYRAKRILSNGQLSG